MYTQKRNYVYGPYKNKYKNKQNKTEHNTTNKQKCNAWNLVQAEQVQQVFRVCLVAQHTKSL